MKKSKKCLYMQSLQRLLVVGNSDSMTTKLYFMLLLILKFCSILKSTLQENTRLQGTPLTAREVSEAESFLYKQAQARSFSQEITRLSAATPLPVMKNSRLRNVNPFLSKEGLLLVGGRLRRANVSTLQANPVILSASDWLTKLIFKHYHVILSHCGPTLLIAHTATILYVVAARQLAKSVCRDCMVCKRRVPKAMAQMMGQLPAPRVNPALCFLHTGVDYAGPILLKRGNPRKPSITKGYLAIFVCLSTKAVHIEVVSSLSTQALLAAIRRFTYHKGLPTHFYSDNGSNFVGARHELSAFLSLESTESAVRECVMSKRITWHHIPQRAPHFGGIWESVVKSTKFHLRRTVGTVQLYYEELSTVICQISACLNSRPYLAQDCHDGGRSTTDPRTFSDWQTRPSLPVDADLTLTKRWELCQALVQLFWDMWSKSYLSSLQKRHKWQKPLPNVGVGDLVMLLEETPLATQWKMGKVSSVYPGADGLVCAADVEVASTIFPKYYHTTTRKLGPRDLTVKKTIYRRPVVKLAPLMATKQTLPVDENAFHPGGGCSSPDCTEQRQPSV